MEGFRKLVSRFRPESKKAGQSGKMTVTAVITRADGTVENLGTVAEGYVKDWETVKQNISGGK